jgi:phosphoribosylanthranilate isomerase
LYRVKICGVTRAKDVRFAAKAGADAIGFQMSLGPRKLTTQMARKLVKITPPLVLPVGVFVNESLSRIKQLIKLCGFKAVQLNGEEEEGFCGKIPVPVVRAIRMKGRDTFLKYKSFQVAAYLLDSYNKNLPGGTGKSFPFAWARKAVHSLPGPVLLAGGLNPHNVEGAIRASQAFGVDVASGVEIRPGVKDPRKVLLFIRRAKKALKAGPKVGTTKWQ